MFLFVCFFWSPVWVFFFFPQCNPSAPATSCRLVLTKPASRYSCHSRGLDAAPPTRHTVAPVMLIRVTTLQLLAQRLISCECSAGAAECVGPPASFTARFRRGSKGQISLCNGLYISCRDCSPHISTESHIFPMTLF